VAGIPYHLSHQPSGKQWPARKSVDWYREVGISVPIDFSMSALAIWHKFRSIPGNIGVSEDLFLSFLV